MIGGVPGKITSHGQICQNLTKDKKNIQVTKGCERSKQKRPPNTENEM